MLPCSLLLTPDLSLFQFILESLLKTIFLEHQPHFLPKSSQFHSTSPSWVLSSVFVHRLLFSAVSFLTAVHSQTFSLSSVWAVKGNNKPGFTVTGKRMLRFFLVGQVPYFYRSCEETKAHLAFWPKMRTFNHIELKKKKRDIMDIWDMYRKK